MVLNSQMVVRAANLSADLCQYIACNPEHLNSDQVLDLVFCYPFQQIRRLSLCLWTFFCFPSPDFFYLSSSSSSSDDDDDDDEGSLIYVCNSHSD